MATGEKKMFENIWGNRKHICFICGRWIPEACTFSFAHILGKNMNPKYRLVEANIALVCSIFCHREVDRLCNGKKYEIQKHIDNGTTITKKLLESLDF